MRKHLLILVVGLALGLTLGGCRQAAETEETATAVQGGAAGAVSTATSTAVPTATFTPTPEPYRPARLRFPFDPRELGQTAYRATYRVTLAPAGAEAKPLRGLRYIAVNTPKRLDPFRAWIPSEYRGEDFLALFGLHWEGGRPLSWAYYHNMGRGSWMDGHLRSAWYDLAPEQAHHVMEVYLLREAQILRSAALAFFPEGQEEVLGVQATRYRVTVADEAVLNRMLAPTWFYDVEIKRTRYGRTRLDTLEEGWLLLGPEDLVLGFSLRFRGTFTSLSEEVLPVTLALTYEVQSVPTSLLLTPERIPANSDVILPAPVAPPYFTDNLREMFTYLGSPHTGLVWGMSFPVEKDEEEAQELFDTFREVFQEVGYRVLEMEPNPMPDVYGRLPFQDEAGYTWYLTIARKSVQIFQPPDAAPIWGEDQDYFGLPLLPDVVCAALGGAPGPDHTCRVTEETVCAADDLLKGTCPDQIPETALMLPPAAQTCMNGYGQVVFTSKGQWQCRFAPGAACELQAYAEGSCLRGGGMMENLKPQPEQFSLVVEGHLRPGESRFFRLPSWEKDFPPVEQESAEGEMLLWAPQGYVFLLESDADDVTVLLFDPSGNKVRTSTTVSGQFLVDTGADGNILELRAGGQATDFTLTVAALGMMGQGNVPFTAVGTVDDSGARYFLRFKPFSTLTIRLSGSGVYLGVYELPRGSTLPSRVLVRPEVRKRSVVLGPEADQVLIVVYGPPKARFRLYTLQHFVGP